MPVNGRENERQCLVRAGKTETFFRHLPSCFIFSKGGA